MCVPLLVLERVHLHVPLLVRAFFVLFIFLSFSFFWFYVLFSSFLFNTRITSGTPWLLSLGVLVAVRACVIDFS